MLVLAVRKPKIGRINVLPIYANAICIPMIDCDAALPK